MTKSENQDFLLQAKESGETASVLSKVMKEFVDVEFSTRQDEVDMLEFDEVTLNTAKEQYKLENSGEAKKNIEKIEEHLKEIESKKNEIAKEKTKAKLSSLKYRDLRLIQTAIQEALITTQGMGFDNETRVVMVIREKKLMTIYCALRKHNSPSERFFSSLEEIVTVSERVIDELYETYAKEFILTETERKK